MADADSSANEEMPVRRPIRARDTQWANDAANCLIAMRVRPNCISLMSVVFAALAGFCLWRSHGAIAMLRSLLFLLAAAAIQMRLICNLLDGMVAVGAGIQSKCGEVFNDMPDRFSDCLILIGAGYAIRNVGYGVELGWLAALLAVITAYVRVLGGSLGLKQNFIGPMAKPHRMAVMTIALVAAAFVSGYRTSDGILLIALVVIVIGCAMTIWRRTARVVREIEGR